MFLKFFSHRTQNDEINMIRKKLMEGVCGDVTPQEKKKRLTSIHKSKKRKKQEKNLRR